MPTITPTLIVDTREQDPLPLRRYPNVRDTLTSGDYSVAGLQDLFAIERKSIADLVASVTVERERFERELHRLRGFRFARLLIVGAKAEVEQHRYRSNATPRAVLHSLCAFEARYTVPVVWNAIPDKAGAQVETWAYWFAREIFKAAKSLAAVTQQAP